MAALMNQVLDAACENGDLTRAGVLEAFEDLKDADTGGLVVPIRGFENGKSPSLESFVLQPADAPGGAKLLAGGDRGRVRGEDRRLTPAPTHRRRPSRTGGAPFGVYSRPLPGDRQQPHREDGGDDGGHGQRRRGGRGPREHRHEERDGEAHVGDGEEQRRQRAAPGGAASRAVSMRPAARQRPPPEPEQGSGEDQPRQPPGRREGGRRGESGHTRGDADDGGPRAEAACSGATSVPAPSVTPARTPVTATPP